MSITEIATQVGPQTASDNSNPTARSLRDGSVAVAESHARYYEQTYRKNTFHALALGVAVTAVATSMTGLLVVNPLGSPVNLSLQKIRFEDTTTSASATSVGLCWFNTLGVYGGTTLTPVTVVPGFLGSGVGKALAASAINSTNGTPVEFMTILHNTAAIATTGEDGNSIIDLEGAIIVPPGLGIGFCAVGAAATGNGYIQWEEVPV